MSHFKAARLQKPHLPRLVLEIVRLVRTELFQPHLGRQLEPVNVHLVQHFIDDAGRVLLGLDPIEPIL